MRFRWKYLQEFRLVWWHRLDRFARLAHAILPTIDRPDGEPDEP